MSWALILLSYPAGRKEITTFFYIYLLLTVASLILDSGVVPPGSSAYPYFASVQNGLTSALCISLMINGFVGFQLYEDGTTLSVWLLRLCSLAMFIVCGAVSLLTFNGWGGLGPNNTVGLFVVLYIFNAIFLAVYVVMQILLVVNTLQDRWPLGDIIFGIFSFVIGQVILYAFSDRICTGVQHYLDGLFFATTCNLLAVMMIYKVGLFCSSLPRLLHGRLTMLTIAPCSTGTLSLARTSSSALARTRTIGRSKNSCRKTSVVTRLTSSPSTTAVSPTCPSAVGRTTEATGVIDTFCSGIG